jgi:hypothetical protein
VFATNKMKPALVVAACLMGMFALAMAAEVRLSCSDVSPGNFEAAQHSSCPATQSQSFPPNPPTPMDVTAARLIPFLQVESYDKYGYDSYGYDKYGYDKSGYDKYGYAKDGYHKEGYDRWAQQGQLLQQRKQ